MDTFLLVQVSKQDLRCEASSMYLENTLKVMMTDKEDEYVKREEKRHSEKEEKIVNFIHIQRKTIEVQERKLKL
jgi:23S rRNA maturation mini-RNase III